VKHFEGEGADRKRAQDALEVLLRKDVSVSDLTESKAGKLLKRVAKQGDASVASLAKRVMDKWMDVIKEAVKKDENGKASQDEKGWQSQSSQPEGPASGRGSEAGTAPVEFQRTGNEKRDKVREKLIEALGRDGTAEAAVVRTRAQEIEEAMFEQFGRVVEKPYLDKYRALSYNLRDPKNASLRREVLEGELEAVRLVTMRAEDLANAETRGLFEEMRKQRLRAEMQAAPEQVTTDEFKCGKCGKRKCTYYQKQTRSSDEPMTTFITCVNCGHKWREC